MPKRTKILEDWSGGLNTFDATSALEDNESSLMYNVTGDREGVLRLGSSEGLHSVLGAKYQANQFVAGENLHIMQSDYNLRGEFTGNITNPPFHIISGIQSYFNTVSSTHWAVGANGGASLSLDTSKGALYGAGHATGTSDAFLKYNATDAGKPIHANKWYSFYMVMRNYNKAAQTASPGWLELLLGVTAADGNRMRPHKYSRAWVTGDNNPRGGIYIHPHQSQVSTAFSRVTSSTTDYYTVIASGICQAPSNVPEAGGDVYIYGHLNGTDTSPTSLWRIVQFSLAEVPSDRDFHTTTQLRHNTEGEIVIANGGRIHRWDGANFSQIGNQFLKTWDGGQNTNMIANAADTDIRSTTDSYQGDNLFRISEGSFAEPVDSYIIGPIVAALDDTAQDTFDAGDATGTDVTNSAYLPELRTYINKAQDPNSAMPRKTYVNELGTESTRNMFPLVLSDTAGSGTGVDNDYNVLYELCHHGSVALQVVEGGASDPDEINDDWKKNWYFGISYKLRDNSYTNVQQAFTHDHDDTGTGLMWHARIIDGATHDSNVDGTHTSKTVTFATGTTVSDAKLYIKNKTLVGVEFVTLPTDVGTNILFTIAADQFGGSNIAYGVITKRAELTAGSGSIDMTAWSKNPRISLSFKEDSLPPNIIMGSATDAPAYYQNLYHTQWYNTARLYAFGENFRDPRINGFIIWAYAVEDVSDHADIPWNPIMEVDLDKKTFLNYTYNRVEEDLVHDNRYNGYKNSYGGYKKWGEWANYWTTGPGFDSFDTGDDGYHHNKAPGIELTYKELIGYNSTEDLGVRFKCSTILNGRAVVGNILRGGTQYPDRISVSSALTYDAFPQSEARDVSLNDGEDIIALAGFADKLLVYKRNLMYVVNFTDPDSWFVEGTYHNYGISHKSSVVISDYGVSWINRHTGVLHFDGQQVTDLTKDKLDFNDFGFGLTNGLITVTHISSIGFETKSKELYIRIDANKNGTGDGTVSSKHGWCYSFKAQDWYLTYAFYDNSTEDTAEAQSNFINTNDGSLIYYRTDQPGNSAYPLTDSSNATAIRVIDPFTRLTPDADLIAKYQSKEMDFGDAAVDKIIYKVIIKHKYGTSGGAGWTVKGIANGNYGTTVTLPNTLDDDDGTWTITEHVCGNEFKNVKTFAVELIAPTSSNDKLFEVDYINVIYRLKSAK